MKSCEKNKWLHYTSIELKTIRTEITQNNAIVKPNGLWCSYNDEWLEWCSDSEFYTFNPDNYYLYEITIKPDAKILTIDSFDKYNKLEKYKNIKGNDNYETVLDWKKIKNDFDGIEFLNYHQIKMDMFQSKIFDLTISTLDVSCCCIWNPVYSIELLDHVIVNSNVKN